MLRSKLVHFCLTLTLLLVFTVSCGETDNFKFPQVYLNVTINVKQAGFITLDVPGNSQEILVHPNGESSIGFDNNGIVVYNTGDDREPFYAFDRTCPHDLPGSVAVKSNGNNAKCPKCGSVYVFPSEGQPSTGSVSKYFLEKYRTYYNPNTGDLRIQN